MNCLKPELSHTDREHKNVNINFRLKFACGCLRFWLWFVFFVDFLLQVCGWNRPEFSSTS